MNRNIAFEKVRATSCSVIKTTYDSLTLYSYLDYLLVSGDYSESSSRSGSVWMVSLFSLCYLRILSANVSIFNM